MTASISTSTNQPAKRKPVPILVILLVILTVVAPITVYWVVERYDMHQRWDLQARYAQQFFFHAGYAANLINGTFARYGSFAHWNNDTVTTVSNELAYADDELYGIEVLDTSHVNQLSRISYAIETLRTDDYLQNPNQSARNTLASQLMPLSHKIINAYWNYGNYTSISTGVGPPFWYSGPFPPDE